MSENCNNNFVDLSKSEYPFYLKRTSSRGSKRSSRSSGDHRPKRLIRRLVKKSGKFTFYREVHSERSYKYLVDYAHTLITSQWYFTILILISSFIFTWFFFAWLWMIISKANGDLDQKEGDTSTPCLSGVNSFAGYLLFSIETQTSIGYGTRSINHHCPEAVFLMCLQLIMSVCICGGLLSIVYTKLSGPHRLHSLDSFSKYAVVCQRDGKYCIVFRIRDPDGKYQCHNKISAYLVDRRRGELFLKELDLEKIGVMIWPIEIVHKINLTSPFWNLSAKDLVMRRFEIILTMEGESASTCCMSTVTTSYISTEILWGHIFTPCVKFSKTNECYIVDHKLFNTTEEIVMPLCSANRLNEILHDICVDASNITTGLLPNNNTTVTEINNNNNNNSGSDSDTETSSSSYKKDILIPVMIHSAINNLRENVSDDKICTKNNEKEIENHHMISNKKNIKLENLHSNDPLKSLEDIFVHDNKYEQHLSLEDLKKYYETSL